MIIYIKLSILPIPVLQCALWLVLLHSPRIATNEANSEENFGRSNGRPSVISLYFLLDRCSTSGGEPEHYKRRCSRKIGF